MRRRHASPGNSVLESISEGVTYISQTQVIFLVFLAFYVFLGMLASYSGPINEVNLLFGADNPRAYNDIARIEGDHYRVKVHPLLLLLVQPVVLAANGLTNYMPLAVLLVIAVVGAAMVALFSDALRMIGIALPIRFIFTLILGLSFSNVHYASVAETFLFAGLGLVAFWWYVIRAVTTGKDNLTRSEWFILVFFGIVEFGITLTNFLSYVIGIIYLLRTREGCEHRVRTFLLLNIAWFVAVLVLIEIQRVVWEGTPRFWGSIYASLFMGGTYEETLYMSWAIEANKTCMWLKELFCFPLIAPQVAIGQDGWLCFREYPILSFGAIICFYVILLIELIDFVMQGVRDGLPKGNAKRMLLYFAVIAFLANAMLHYIYGAWEAFMYSPHYLFLLLIVAAIATDSIGHRILKRIIIALLVAFVAIECIANLAAFSDTVTYINDRLQMSTSLLKAFGVCLFVEAIAVLIAWKAKLLLKDKAKILPIALSTYGILVAIVSVFIFISY